MQGFSQNKRKKIVESNGFLKVNIRNKIKTEFPVLVIWQILQTSTVLLSYNAIKRNFCSYKRVSL